jgi:hypothetical protein
MSLDRLCIRNGIKRVLWSAPTLVGRGTLLRKRGGSVDLVLGTDIQCMGIFEPSDLRSLN